MWRLRFKIRCLFSYDNVDNVVWPEGRRRSSKLYYDNDDCDCEKIIIGA